MANIKEQKVKLYQLEKDDTKITEKLNFLNLKTKQLPDPKIDLKQ